MKKFIVQIILILGLLAFPVTEKSYADDDCDWFCEIGNYIDDISDWTEDTYNETIDITEDLSALTLQLTETFDPLLESQKIFVNFRDNPPECTQLFSDITAIDPGFNPDNPTTDDFFTARLLMGLPLDYVKAIIPSDTVGTKARAVALVPYYTYLWCMAGVERDMINADTAVRDNYHLSIIDSINMVSEQLNNIDGRLDQIDSRLDRVENLLITPPGKRESWNK